MISEEILKKAIEKAVENGYKLPFLLSNDNNFKTILINIDTKTFCDNSVLKFAINGLFFSQDFAKAFWGEEIKIFELEDICDGTDNFYGFGGKLIYSYTEGGSIKYEGKSWKYHLQQMVLEEDPIKYLEQFL